MKYQLFSWKSCSDNILTNCMSRIDQPFYSNVLWTLVAGFNCHTPYSWSFCSVQLPLQFDLFLNQCSNQIFMFCINVWSKLDILLYNNTWIVRHYFLLLFSWRVLLWLKYVFMSDLHSSYYPAWTLRCLYNCKWIYVILLLYFITEEFCYGYIL